MMILVTYDVSFGDEGGKTRLRKLAKLCRDYGQRVQYSVFEIEVDPAQWAMLKAKMLSVINPNCDSLRIYYLGSHWQHKVEHVGAKAALDLNGPLIF